MKTTGNWEEEEFGCWTSKDDYKARRMIPYRPTDRKKESQGLKSKIITVKSLVFCFIKLEILLEPDTIFWICLWNVKFGVTMTPRSPTASTNLMISPDL